MSPAYDMNPDPDGDGLRLNVSDVENQQDIDLALEVADYFRVTGPRGKSIVAEIVSAFRQWRSLAKEMALPSEDIERMETAFRVVEQWG